MPFLTLGDSKPVSVPFTTNPDGLVLVPGTVGGTISAQFIFDTGAGLDVLAPSLIEKVHGKAAGQFSGFRMTGERMDIPLFVISELSIGPVVKRDVLVGSWDVLDKFHFDGIIAQRDFREQPLTFDFVHKVLVFETPKTMAQRRAAGKALPLQFDEQRGIALSSFAEFQIGNQSGQCEIDTGSPGATVSMRYMGPLGIDTDGKDVQKHEGRTIAGATEIDYRTSLAQISLASAPQIALEHPGVSFSDIIYDCVVGVDFWSGKTLPMDIGKRELIVSVPASRQ